MDNNKKAIIEDIFNRMVKIQLLDFVDSGSTTKDRKSIDFKYNNHMTVNAIIKKCGPCTLRDYSFDILRDETYASLYEVMVKISDDFSEDELLQIYQDIDTKKLEITNRFLVSCYKLSVFSVKKNLSGHRRSNHGLLPARDYCEYNEEVLNKNGIDLASSSVEDIDADICFFLRFFHEHKEEFLTRRQIQFINDPSTVSDKNVSSFRKRIYKNTLEAFQKEFTNDDDRINELQDQVKTIERILESKDFPAQIIKFRDRSYINDTLTSYVDLPIMRRFNHGDYSYEVLKQYRVALFKALNNINNLLNKAKNEDGREDVLM